VSDYPLTVEEGQSSLFLGTYKVEDESHEASRSLTTLKISSLPALSSTDPKLYRSTEALSFHIIGHTTSCCDLLLGDGTANPCTMCAMGTCAVLLLTVAIATCGACTAVP